MSRVYDGLTLNSSSGLHLGQPNSINFLSAATAPRTVNFQDATGTVVLRDTTDILTNKTLTSTTNNITANSLLSSTTTINISSANSPTVGQVLTANSPTSASWVSPSGNPGSTGSSGTITTTNATPALIQSIPTANNTSYLINSKICARRTDSGSESGGYILNCVFKRGVTTATLTKVGSTDLLSIEDDPTWNVICSANTTTGMIEIHVVGALAKTINWQSSTMTVIV